MAGQPQMGQDLLTVDAVRSHFAYQTQWESSVRMIGLSQRLLPDNIQLSQKTYMSSAEFEPTIPASEWPQTHALDHEATVSALSYYRADIVKA